MARRERRTWGGKREGAGRPFVSGDARTPTVRVTVSLLAEQQAWLEAAAASREVSVSELVRELIDRARKRAR